MSSFQIELTPTLAPTVGILLNVTPDHLDRHGTMEAYAGLKARLVQDALHPIVGDDDDWCRDISERLRLADRSWVDIVSAQSRVRYGWYATDSTLVSGAPWTGPAGAFADLAGIGALRGRHNIQNALAASAAAMHLGVPAADVAAALKTFPGLPHRLEEIGRVGRTLFINDSKATNADSAATALAAFARDVFWILGGRPKQGGIASLAPFFPRVAKAYLIGEATEEFAATLDGHVPFARCGTLDKAVAAASADAAASGAPEPVVLLSPACASFDHYRNFEVRGDAFRALVAALPGIELRGGRDVTASPSPRATPTSPRAPSARGEGRGEGQPAHSRRRRLGLPLTLTLSPQAGRGDCHRHDPLPRREERADRLVVHGRSACCSRRSWPSPAPAWCCRWRRARPSPSSAACRPSTSSSGSSSSSPPASSSCWPYRCCRRRGCAGWRSACSPSASSACCSC